MPLASHLQTFSYLMVSIGACPCHILLLVRFLQSSSGMTQGKHLAYNKVPKLSANQLAGNLSSIANFMFGSAYLGVDDPLAAAQNLSSAVLSIHLPPATQQEAFVQAINQTLYQAQPEAAAVLLAAALSADETAAVSEGFTLVSLNAINTQLCPLVCACVCVCTYVCACVCVCACACACKQAFSRHTTHTGTFAQ